MKLEELRKGQHITGIIPNTSVVIASVDLIGNHAAKVIYEDYSGNVAQIILYRDNEPELNILERNRPWSFEGDGALFRLTAEAQRIKLAHLYDPLLAIHTSKVEPLPHQLTAVYDIMLKRQPLRFLLADDPGAGKTIMTGLYIKELIIRSELHRCLIVCPGSLVEQWQNELWDRFNLEFEIMTLENLEATRAGNWFDAHPLAIARLDKLARNTDLQEIIKSAQFWDLVVCDEAHKMSASYNAGEIRYTKRHKLGQLLSQKCRNFLLLTATPHNGKDYDFHLFLSLLDSDRFVNSFHDSTYLDVSDIMRRMVKENLVKFDNTPLFPERIAETVTYKLTPLGAQLYNEVTEYVKEQFNLAERLADKKKGNSVGFALTMLQRRLASSPEAIYQSLVRRRNRLEKSLNEAILQQKALHFSQQKNEFDIDEEDFEELEYDTDIDNSQSNEIIDQASAALDIHQLKLEIERLKELEMLALEVLKSNEDPKWLEVVELLDEIIVKPKQQSMNNNNFLPIKLIIFTEHRDTLNYLERKISQFLGSPNILAIIHGGLGRDERFRMQEKFNSDPEVQILLATDAAGEGINLQRANKMINYDLPWNPNRIEQRFGRIHRIGQTEVCHLWNLVADETIEGQVFKVLLEKINLIKETLKGKTFDVLGQLRFDGKPLKDLLIEAIRYGESPEVRERILRKIEQPFEPEQLKRLLEDNALTHEALSEEQVRYIRAYMERAEARKLQPYYIETFFLKAFKLLGGRIFERENNRFEVKNVPFKIRERARSLGLSKHILDRYERITFDKKDINVPGFPVAQFVCPGHPLLDATIDLIFEQYHGLLKSGTILVDDNALDDNPKVIFYLEHAITDAVKVAPDDNKPHVISKRLLFVQIDQFDNIQHFEYPPYLDYRPLKLDDPESPEPTIKQILQSSFCDWINEEVEEKVTNYAIVNVATKHLEEVKNYRLEQLEKIRKAVEKRLKNEINYWQSKALRIRANEEAGKFDSKISSQEAEKRCEEFKLRLANRLELLEKERKLTSLPPVIYGGFVVIPKPLLDKITGKTETTTPSTFAEDTQTNAVKARQIVIEHEKQLGFIPKDVENEKLGYDIESFDPNTGKLRFIEVKGRIHNAPTVTVTKNEVLFSFNKPEDYFLVIVEFFENGEHKLHYINKPFHKEPDFDVNSINYDLSKLIAKATYTA